MFFNEMGYIRLVVLNNVVFRQAASTSAGNLLEMQIITPTPDLLNKKFWEWNAAICVLTSLLHDFDTKSGLRTNTAVVMAMI